MERERERETERQREREREKSEIVSECCGSAPQFLGYLEMTGQYIPKLYMNSKISFISTSFNKN